MVTTKPTDILTVASLHAKEYRNTEYRVQRIGETHNFKCCSQVSFRCFFFSVLCAKRLFM